jgi:transglutaminase-like putative cysteine protease
VSFIQAVRRANQPGVPEDSIRLRLACLSAATVGIAACASLGEIAWPTAIGAMVLVAVGMVFSHATRARPPWWVKLLVAVGAIAACFWFFHAVSSQTQGIASVINPLTILLVSVLVVHSFHVPSRRDLLFTLGASAGLMAVAGALAIDLRFGLFVVAWACCSLWGLSEMWTSASGGGRMSVTGLVLVVLATSTAAAAVFLVLPAPVVSSRVSFIARAGSGGSVGVPGGLAGDSGSPAQLSRPGNPNSRIRVGGYLGFAASLNTALRGDLGTTLVMQVRAQRPSYWVGETFDTWQGQSWTESQPVPRRALRQSSPFVLPVSFGDVPFGQSDLQTFYVANPTANLVFHAESANELWFPAGKVYVAGDGTIVSPLGLGSGSVYTVDSQVSTATPAQLRADDGPYTLPADLERQEVQLPHAYPRVLALAQKVTAGDTSTYDKVQSLIHWIGSHTRYSEDIPPLPAGADTVDEFLFGNRVGFCEQISTSLAVMLRSLDIPVREAVGYVPGGFNPITDLYQVHASDAHAWVQVWFPGYGWQDFDPTASVPPGPPSPGATALHDVGAALRQVPPVPVAVLLVAAGLTVVLVRWRRTRPPTWGARVARAMERAGRRAGLARRPSETLSEYAARLDAATGPSASTWRELAAAVSASAYGGPEPLRAAQRAMVDVARQTRVPRHVVRAAPGLDGVDGAGSAAPAAGTLDPSVVVGSGGRD